MRVRTRVREANWASDKADARQRVGEDFARTAYRNMGSEVIRSGRVISGRMLYSIYDKPMPSKDPERSTWHVGSALDYFAYQNYGMGPIFPVRASALTLHFRRQGFTLVRARTFQPVAPGDFLKGTLASLKNYTWSG